jgi:hypothetical protein
MDSASVSVECPSCHKRLRAPGSAAGKNVRCPNCHTLVAVLAPEADEPRGPLVLHPVPQSAPQASSAPFDFDSSPAPAPVAPAEKVDSKQCVLCGNDEASEDFFICTSAEDGVVLRWINFPVRACEECFDTVSRFRTLQNACSIGGAVALLVLAVVGVLVGMDKLPPLVLVVAVVPLLVALVGVGASAVKRRQLMERPALTPTLKRLRSAYHKATGIWEVVFTPVVEPVKGETAESVR